MDQYIGQHLKGYRLTQRLGVGGFGTVYLGEYMRDHSQAAIKLLKIPSTGEENVKEFFKQFINEARNASRLKHPHIVPLLDFGIQGEIPFLIMEYAPYGSLRKHHPRGTQVPFATVVLYVRQISLALQYAHENGLVHRDVKPENILVGKNNELLLTDFGIAVPAHSTYSWEEQKAVGSWDYAAPEHFDAKAVPASDQYSLAVMVYEWLAGAPPFRGNFVQLWSQHQHHVPPPSLHEKGNISLAVEQVVRNGLAKTPQGRYPSVLAFAEALEQAVLAHQTTRRSPHLPINPALPPMYPSLPPQHISLTAPPVGQLPQSQRLSHGLLPTEPALPQNQLWPPTEPVTSVSQPAQQFDPNIQYREGAIARSQGDLEHLERAAFLWQQILDYYPNFGNGVLASQMTLLLQELHPLRVQKQRDWAEEAHTRGEWKQEMNACCGTVLSSIPPTQPAILPGQRINAPTGNLPPNMLLKQQYLILGLLGQGGMGAVYKAADTKWGKALRAVKEMGLSGFRSHSGSLYTQALANAAAAFQREAEMLANLRHQNLPRIYDYFSEQGRWYLVMDYIDGSNLDQYLQARSGFLPIQESLAIGIQLCTVLDYLHTRQPPIVFRDLKPANIMRTNDGHLYLIDFGIARLFKSGQTKDTYIAYSYGYTAPEQYGKAQTTPQADIYSLGATLHQLISGEDPTNMPTPWGFTPLRLSGPAGATSLANLIARMLELDPTNRPASAAQVKQELQHIATGQPSPLVSPPRSGQGTTLLTYRGHIDEVRSVAWSPDGTRIASGSRDKTVQVWDAQTGKLLLTYTGHTSRIRSVAWSPDGTRIASTGDDGIRSWDVRKGGDSQINYKVSPGWTIRGWSVAWSPDGTRIASVVDKTVWIWDARKEVPPLLACTTRGTYPGLTSVAWSPDGTRIASGRGDFEPAWIWNAQSGGPPLQIPMPVGGWSVAWSPDGTRIALAGRRTVQICDARRGGPPQLICTVPDGEAALVSVAWSPDGTRIASGGRDKVAIWDVRSGGLPLFTYTGHTSEVRSLAWSPDGTRIVSAGDYETVQVWQS